MISIIYPYRGRDLQRIKKSLDSLQLQSNSNFEVHFIDYGTKPEMAKKVQQLVSKYTFVNYTYSYHIDTLWNKSRALNIIIKQLKTLYCFVADVDMIFHSEFIDTLHQVKDSEKVTYFQVGFLSQEESQRDVKFDDFNIKFISESGATGLSLFPVKVLKDVNGFDEYYHLWGAEDTDLHNRLKIKGLHVVFYDSKILLLHQFHKIYRSYIDNKISQQITIEGIAKLNHEYCLEQLKNKRATANGNGVWGEIQSFVEYQQLLLPDQIEEITLKKKAFNEWLLALNNSKDTEIKLYKLKGSNSLLDNCGSKLRGKYTLKEASDLLLLNHIKHLRNKKYLYRVSKDCKKIEYTLCQK